MLLGESQVLASGWRYPEPLELFIEISGEVYESQQKTGKGYSSLILMFRNFITNGPWFLMPCTWSPIKPMGCMA